MKKIGIIGAMEVEIEDILNELDSYYIRKHAGLNYYVGNINGIEVIVLSCGIGKVNAAIYTQILIDQYSIDLIINTGIAGALTEEVNHLSLVISKQLTYYDVKKLQMINCFPNQEFFKADKNLIDLATRVSRDNKLEYHVGTIVTGESFISDTKTKKELNQKFNALCVEMEGAAIAHVAFVNNIPFVVIRCISDLANEATNDDYKKFEKSAASKAANLVRDLIYQL